MTMRKGGRGDGRQPTSRSGQSRTTRRPRASVRRAGPSVVADRTSDPRVGFWGKDDGPSERRGGELSVSLDGGKAEVGSRGGEGKERKGGERTGPARPTFFHKELPAGRAPWPTSSFAAGVAVVGGGGREVRSSSRTTTRPATSPRPRSSQPRRSSPPADDDDNEAEPDGSGRRRRCCCCCRSVGADGAGGEGEGGRTSLVGLARPPRITGAPAAAAAAVIVAVGVVEAAVKEEEEGKRKSARLVSVGERNRPRSETGGRAASSSSSVGLASRWGWTVLARVGPTAGDGQGGERGREGEAGREPGRRRRADGLLGGRVILGEGGRGRWREIEAKVKVKG